VKTKERMRMSDRQTEANRRNAQLSTGPKTAEGKAAVASNALKHGLTGKQMVLPGENPEDFEAFRSDISNRLNLSGELEGALAERLIADLWRLRRVPALEVALYNRGYKEEASENDLIIPIRALHIYPEIFASLWRHENALKRSLSKTLDDLQRLQEQRASEHVPTPAVVDVDVSVAQNGAPPLESFYKTNPN
jgi:hypothetical protein